MLRCDRSSETPQWRLPGRNAPCFSAGKLRASCNYPQVRGRAAGFGNSANQMREAGARPGDEAGILNCAKIDDPSRANPIRSRIFFPIARHLAGPPETGHCLSNRFAYAVARNAENQPMFLANNRRCFGNLTALPPDAVKPAIGLFMILGNDGFGGSDRSRLFCPGFHPVSLAFKGVGG